MAHWYEHLITSNPERFINVHDTLQKKGVVHRIRIRSHKQKGDDGAYTLYTIYTDSPNAAPKSV